MRADIVPPCQDGALFAACLPLLQLLTLLDSKTSLTRVHDQSFDTTETMNVDAYFAVDVSPDRCSYSCAMLRLCIL